MGPIPVLRNKAITSDRFSTYRITGRQRQASITRQGGFTLIEMMVAVSIIAIVLTAVYRLHSQTLMMTIGARFYTVAPLLAQNKLVDIELSSAQELAQGTGDFGKDFPDYTWEVGIEDIDSGQLMTGAEQLKGAVEKLKRIDIKVLFNEGEMVYNLRTYRFIEK